MALEDYNSLIVEHLQEVLAAADLADGDAVGEFLEKLRVEGFDPDELERAKALHEEREFNQLLEWAGEHVMRLSPDEDPFAEGAFDFDVDDAFLDVEDTGFRQPSEEIDPSEVLVELEDGVDGIEVLDEASLSDSSGASPPEAKEDPVAVQTPGRPHVLSGKFNLIDKSKIEEDKKQRSLSDSLDAAAAAADAEEAADSNKQTRPNVTPDLAEIREGAGDTDRPFDSGASQARYQADEPAPPLHRLPATSDISGEIATTPPELSDEDSPLGDAFRASSEASVASDSDEPPSDEFSIEIIDAPDSEEVHAEPSEPVEPAQLRSGGGFDFGFDDEELDAGPEPDSEGEDDFEFDLGFTNPANSAPDPGATKPGPDPGETRQGNEHLQIADRERDLTPLRQLPAQDPEDMFFELAEALAAESSGAEQYRGEPLRANTAETNPFGNDAPTGTQHSPLPAESVNNAAQSHVQTNMNAILLEAHRLRSTGELEAALDITKKVLSRGANHDAEKLRREIETQLEAGHVEKLGELSATPTLAIELAQMAQLDLDHRAGYVISQVDGMMTFEDLIELSGMSRLETLDVLCDLIDQGVIQVS